MTAEIIYVLCAATSCFCFALLARGFMRSRARLLLWSSAGFLAITVSNVLLVVDLVYLPHVDLSLWRNGTTLFGLVLLILGLIFTS